MRTLKRLAETMIKTLNPSRDRQGAAQPVQVRGLIVSIQEKIKLRGADENSIF